MLQFVKRLFPNPIFNGFQIRTIYQENFFNVIEVRGNHEILSGNQGKVLNFLNEEFVIILLMLNVLHRCNKYYQDCMMIFFRG